MDSHKSLFSPNSPAPPGTSAWARCVGTAGPAAAGSKTRPPWESGEEEGDCSRCSSDSPTSLLALNAVKLSVSSQGRGYQSFSDFPGETSGSETNAFISKGFSLEIPFKLNIKILHFEQYKVKDLDFPSEQINDE